MTDISQFQYGKITHDRGYIYGESNVTPVAKNKEGHNLYKITREPAYLNVGLGMVTELAVKNKDTLCTENLMFVDTKTTIYALG